MPRGRTRRRAPHREPPHREIEPPRGSPGFILADALAALVIAAMTLTAILGGVAGSLRLAAAQEAKLLALVQQENDRVQQAPDTVVAGR